MCTLLLCVCALLQRGEPDSPLSVAAIEAGIDSCQTRYRNLKFTYLVKEHIKPSTGAELDPFGVAVPDAPREWRNTLSIMESNTTNVSRPWKCWQQFTKDKADSWKLERFLCFDGTKSLSYVRDDRIAYGKWSMGSIVPFEEPSKFQMDIFELFLFLRLDGPSVRFLFGMDLPLDMRFELTGTSETSGRRVLQLSSKQPKRNAVINVEAVTQPDFIVTLWEVTVGGKVVQRFQVNDIRTVNGVSFPASGSYRKTPEIDGLDHTYEFSLERVESLSESARSQWAPKWPAGTIVNDQVNTKNITVPHDKKELHQATLDRRRLEMDSKPIQHGTLSPIRWAFLLCNVVGIVVVIALIYLRRRSRA